MSIVFDGPVLPDDLTVFVREVPLPNLIWLQNVLPDRQVNNNRVDVGKLTKTGRTARFRAYDGPPHVSKRPVAQVSTIQLPPLSDSLGMGELERLQLEFARTGGTNQGVFVDAIYDDATILTQNMHRRMEQARGDLLEDGKFTLEGEGGLFIEADYGVPEGNFVTADISFDDHDHADVIGQLTEWVRLYNLGDDTGAGGNGYNPGGMILPFARLMDLQLNKALRTQYATVVGQPALLSRDQINAIMSTYGLPPIIAVYDSAVDVDGTRTRVLPEDKIVFVPPDPAANLGYTAWGVSATALELVNAADTDMSFSEAPGIVGVVVKDDGVPFQQHTFVDGVGMPVLENPNALMVATVVTDES